MWSHKVTISNTLLATMGSLQTQSGLTTPIFQSPKAYSTWCERGWIRKCWEILQDHNIEFISTSQKCPTLLRVGYTSLMETFANSTKFKQLRKINRCRIYLKAITVSDIATTCGTKINTTRWRKTKPKPVELSPNQLKKNKTSGNPPTRKNNKNGTHVSLKQAKKQAKQDKQKKDSREPQWSDSDEEYQAKGITNGGASDMDDNILGDDANGEILKQYMRNSRHNRFAAQSDEDTTKDNKTTTPTKKEKKPPEKQKNPPKLSNP
jgi:hypothetical protein